MDPVADILAALRANDEPKARALLAAHPGVANAPTAAVPRLLTMAIYARAPAVARDIIASGVEPTLHEAAALGDTARVEALLAAHPEWIESRSPDGMPPLHFAAHFGHADTANLLLDLGADIYALGGPPLENTALHAACAGGQAELVALLLDAAAPTEATDAGGNTPLMVAAAAKRADIVQLLLDAGADANATSAAGKRAIDFARERGAHNVMQLLSERA